MTDLSRVDVRDFLEALGISVAGISGVNAIFSCPWHSDSRPSARMNLDDTRWLCSAGCGAGNAISFLAKLRGMNNSEAASHIDQRYGTGPVMAIGELEREVERNLSSNVEQEDMRKLPSEWWIENFMGSWCTSSEGRRALGYMQHRGFDRETLDAWQIGFDLISGRVAIPVRDANGVLVGFKARAIDQETQPRYLILGDGDRALRPRYGFQPYHKSHHVFGLYLVPPSSRVVLCEGELNVAAMRRKTRYQAVGVAGSQFSERQRALIVERCSSVVVYFDSDRAGVAGTLAVLDALSPYMPVDVVVGAQGDAAELSAEEIMGLVEGARPGLSETVCRVLT